MKKKDKHTFFSISMKPKCKQKIATIFKSKWNTENVKNLLKVKKKDFLIHDVTAGNVFKSNKLAPVYSLWEL